MAITDLLPEEFVQRVVDLGNRIRDEIAGLDLKDLPMEQCEQIPQLLAELEQQLAAAIAADETELGQQQAHETKLFAQANAAEREQLLRDQARARELASEAVHRAQMMLSSLRARTHLAAQISQGLAQQLHSRAEQWAKKAKEAGKLADSLPELILLEGWTGPAARQYGLRAMVQAKAFEEHRQLPALYARLLGDADKATMLELTFVWHALSEARDANASALRARSAQLYPRTRAVAESLRAADVRVKSREPKIAQRDQEFSEVIAAGMAARNFIRDGWPTGTQRAFEKVAHIDPDYTPQDFTKYEEALREEQEEQ